MREERRNYKGSEERSDKDSVNDELTRVVDNENERNEEMEKWEDIND